MDYRDRLRICHQRNDSMASKIPDEAHGHITVEEDQVISCNSFYLMSSSSVKREALKLSLKS
jgi:hypothetical protein